MSKSQAQDGIIASGAELTPVSSEFKFTEGPTADQQGNVYFTDQPNNQIMKWSTDGILSVFMKNAGRANGLYFDNEGRLIACADKKNELWRIDENKEITVLVDSYEGKKLNGPNDVWVHPNGGVYFTDPFYKRDYWEREEKEIEQENVYHLSSEGMLTVAATNLVRPNGIVGTADGTTLFIADINDKKTYRYQIGKNGKLSNRQLFVEMGSDGMTLDEAGNLYLTGKEGVTVFNPQGEQIEQIAVPEGWTANVCFGGKDRK
ncbi:MAG: SMP-30/gluconolactonase/LRE family protein, partial [Tunicatimonas sp.]|uniref:SMP-30/gluconolactonase/LRE family protein n=1 Tax=Tunicatimonas sp. TaxID=1940096 RepID=UPI003C73E893